MPRLILALFIALLASTAAWAEQALTSIDNATLEALMIRGVPVVDIRTPGEWAETGTIPGSRKIMGFDERGRLAPDFLEHLSKVVKPTDEVVLICRSGNRTAALGKALTEQLGYTHVYSVDKGIKRWIGEGRTVGK